VLPESALAELLAETERPLAQAELELSLLEDRIARLRAERYGLQLALARRRGERPPAGATGAAPSQSPPMPPAARLAGPWSGLSRAEAVERVLVDAAEPLTRLDVVERLDAAGRSGDDPDAVSAALAYLQREGRTARVGRGRWAPTGTGARPDGRGIR
jgi:hypothetical protein